MTREDTLNALHTAIDAINDTGAEPFSVYVYVGGVDLLLPAADFRAMFAGRAVRRKLVSGTAHLAIDANGVTWRACEPVEPETSEVVL